MDAGHKIQALRSNIERVIKGKPAVVEMAAVALLARGHLLIEDVPGVGKTTLAHSLARSLGCSFRDRKSTRLNSSHVAISYAVFCLKKKKRFAKDRTGLQI